MTRNISQETADALAEGRLMARDFLWVVARTRDTGDTITDGMWSDDHDVEAYVIDPETGTIVLRAWKGVGTLISISDIPLVSNITVQTVTIALSQVSDHVAQLVRLYDCKQAKVQIFRGMFDPRSGLMVAPAESRFAGFVDEIDIKTPIENNGGSVTLTCVSHTQEMTRSNSDTRSNASQEGRTDDGADEFFKDTAVVGSWEHYWGRASGKVTADTASTLAFLKTGS